MVYILQKKVLNHKHSELIKTYYKAKLTVMKCEIKFFLVGILFLLILIVIISLQKNHLNLKFSKDD